MNVNMKPVWSKVPLTGALALLAGFGVLRAAAQDQGAPYTGDSQADSLSLPSTLTLPAGTAIPVRLIELLSSDQNHPGDRFSASLEQPLVAGGWVVARRGQIVMGRVIAAQKAGRVSGVSQLQIELNELTAVDGQVLPIRTQLAQSSGSSSQGQDAAAVAGTTGIGAVIGAIAGGGQGAGIGAGAGAAAGIVGILTTRGRPTILSSETLLSFRLEVPLEVSTERSRVAFQPVGQGDFADQDAYARRPQRVANGRRLRPYFFDRGYYPPPVRFGYYRFSGPVVRRGFIFRH